MCALLMGAEMDTMQSKEYLVAKFVIWDVISVKLQVKIVRLAL